MRLAFGLLFMLFLLAVTSCRTNNPPPPDGVSVVAPGVRVNVSDAQGVRVAAPGTRVYVQP